MQNFDPVRTPLRGINLIEASAGTGKTYTIATLVMRLVAEHGLDIRNILVVTFTEAATAELRARVRARLDEARRVLLGEETKDVVLLDWLAECEVEPERVQARLDNALRGFDEAAIFTIHGFCQRMLQENAFESGALFNTELIADQSHLLQEIATDFWRCQLYEADPLLVEYALSQDFSPETLQQLLQSYLGRPFLHIIPDEPLPDPQLLEDAGEHYIECYQVVREIWLASAADVVSLLNADVLNKRSYSKNLIDSTVAFLQKLAEQELPSLAQNYAKDLERLTIEKLQKSTKKDKQTPQHPIIHEIEALLDAEELLKTLFDQQLKGLKKQLFNYAREHLAQRKRQLHVQSFDDLLLGIYRALKNPGGERLAQLIGQRYQAALIDEFQDTDGLQYEIFRRVYLEREDSVLFFIGDPKQAIYSFRGADIFTYLGAAEDAQQQYTLGTNWRSAPRLVRAVNSLFSQADQPFLLDGLDFHPVDAAKKDADSPFKDQPLQLMYLQRDQLGLPAHEAIKKEWAKKYIPLLVTSEIVKLLREHRELSAGDIAVLVRKNSQARLVQEALQRARVPAVLYGSESLFATLEAQDLAYLLAAILEPSDERRIRAALSTALLGMNGEQIYQLRHDEQTWDAWLQTFHAYHERWRQQGFIRMFRSVLLELKIPERLLSLVNGERRLTNVLHLSEVLQQASLSSQHSMLALYQWLQNQLAHPDLNKEHELRLESDAHAVKLVTVHKSKGLEYPVVFLPFAWESDVRAHRQEEFCFHDDTLHPPQLVLDLGSDEQELNRETAIEEERAESVRLLYVALTRAKYRCYLYWGAFLNSESAALCHLLHPTPPDEGLWLKTVADQDLLYALYTGLQEEAGKDCVGISMPTLPERWPMYAKPKLTEEVLKARKFHGNISNDWRITSFSALTRQVQQEHSRSSQVQLEQADHDARADQPAPPKPRPGSDPEFANPFALPAGAHTGNLLHELLENLDFQSQPEQRQALIAQKLQAYAFDERWHEAIENLLTRVLQTSLCEEPRFCLADIPRQARLNELEFFYPLQSLDYAQLKTVLAEHGYEDLQDAKGWEAVQGFMKGSIDLIFKHQERFYLIDYKSNYLGGSVTDYQTDAMLKAMQQHHYRLQYLIYCLALHLYLRERLPNYDYEQHVGGVFYLFLRGMSDAPESGRCGVFADKPALSLIEALSQLMINAVDEQI